MPKWGERYNLCANVLIQRAVLLGLSFGWKEGASVVPRRAFPLVCVLAQLDHVYQSYDTCLLTLSRTRIPKMHAFSRTVTMEYASSNGYKQVRGVGRSRIQVVYQTINARLGWETNVKKNRRIILLLLLLSNGGVGLGSYRKTPLSLFFGGSHSLAISPSSSSPSRARLDTDLAPLWSTTQKEAGGG